MWVKDKLKEETVTVLGVPFNVRIYVRRVDSKYIATFNRFTSEGDSPEEAAQNIVSDMERYFAEPPKSFQDLANRITETLQWENLAGYKQDPVADEQMVKLLLKALPIGWRNW